MKANEKYNGAITREQFLFYEIRIVAKLKLQGLNDEEIKKEIKEGNLFQYPTERMTGNLTQVCLKRLYALNNESLVIALANAPDDVAKQINLYAMMRYYRLIREFMISVIGEKYQTRDFNFSRQDLNFFFTQLQDKTIRWHPGVC